MPTYSKPHYYVTVGGRLGTYDIWQCGVRYPVAGGDDAAALQANVPNVSLSDMYDDLLPYITNTGTNTQLATFVHYDWLKVAVIDTDGQYAGDAHTFTSGTAHGGVNGSGGHPYQVSLVATLWTGEVLGKGNYGRIYLPAPTTPIGPTGAMFAADTATIAGWIKDALNGWAGELSTVEVPNAYPAVMGAGTPPSHKPVTHVRVGGVMDTQRRRRNQIPEIYSDVTLA